MSISPAQNSSASTTQEPLASLLEMIRRAQAGAEDASVAPDFFEPSGGDPLGALVETIAAEANRQSQTPLDQWTKDDDNAKGRATGATAAPAPAGSASAGSASAGSASAGSAPAGSVSEGLEALLGREVLAILRDQPLAGQARAAAAARLASQLDNPDPSALREVLGILVTGQSG